MCWRMDLLLRRLFFRSRRARTYRKRYLQVKNGWFAKKTAQRNYVRDMIVQGNWIYFINDSDHGRLYKMKTDGTGITMITDDTGCYSMNLQDDHIYYLRDIDPTGKESRLNKLYRINTDGTNKAEIPFQSTTEPIEKMVVDEDFIYYLMRSTTESTILNIYRMNTDGSSRVKLLDGFNYWGNYVNMADNKVYYSDNESLNYITKEGETHK
jgi:hypothetical protein